jgi:hypothetical protein
MAEVRKFSLVYDPAEDRLAWDLEAVDGATARLWLTQRLCRGLAEALLKMVPVAATPPEAPPQRRAAVQSWEQAAAMAQFGKVAGVTPQPRSLTGLVSAVHIRPVGERLDLTFDFGEGEQRTLGVDPPALRQLLGVMRRLYAGAGWPMDVWPSWTAETPGAPPADAVN